MDTLRYVPEFRLAIDGAPIPKPLRASVMSVTLHSGLEGADRVEITLVNDGLRWLDEPLFGLDRSVVLELGYAGQELDQVFVGEVVGTSA